MTDFPSMGSINDESRIEGQVRQARFGLFASCAAATLAALGALHIIGWEYGVEALQIVAPSSIGLKANGAVALILGGVAVLVSRFRPDSPLTRWTCIGLGYAVALIGFVTALEYAIGVSLGIDLLLTSPAGTIFSGNPGRMSIVSALCFVLSGSSIALQQSRRFTTANVCALASLILAMLTQLGAIYGSRMIYSIYSSSPMAIEAGIGILLLNTAICCARPDRGVVGLLASETPGGRMMRITFPVLLCWPLFAGWLRMLGENLGLYDRGFGLALFTIFTIATLWGLTIAAAKSTNRKEDSLRERDRRFRALVEHSADVISMSDKNHTVLYSTPSTLELTGYTPEEFVASGETRKIHPDDRMVANHLIQSLFQHPGEPNRFTFRMQHRDGSWRWIEGVATNLLEEPAVRAVVTNYRDVTARHNAEKTAWELNQELASRLIMEESKEYAVYLLDTEGNVSTWNRGAERIKGYLAADILGKHCSVFYTEEERRIGVPEKVLDHANRLGPSTVEGWRVRKDGSRFWARVTTTALRDEIGSLRGYSKVVFDATAKRAAERALQESEEQFRAVAESITESIITINEHSTILFANPATERIFGYPLNDLIGSDLTDLMPEYLRALHRTAIARYIDTNEKHVSWDRVELSGLHRTKGEFPVELSISELVRGGKRMFVGVVRDISRRKQFEAMQQKYASDLERSNAELQQFAYVASHDLQEPLRMVASYTQLLESKYADKLDEEANVFIGYAVDGARRMRQLINDLLTYSRVESRGREFLPVDCESVFADAFANLHLAVSESHATITHDPLPTVTGDHVQLVQLFQNLIGNAIKFHGDSPPRIHMGVAKEDGFWRISVTDNGIGIDPKYFDRLFVIFQRLHTRSTYSGTGIGLAVCRKIVEGFGGRIWVESSPGNGSAFHFTVPA